MSSGPLRKRLGFEQGEPVLPIARALPKKSHSNDHDPVIGAAAQAKISPPFVSSAWPVMAADKSDAR